MGSVRFGAYVPLVTSSVRARRAWWQFNAVEILVIATVVAGSIAYACWIAPPDLHHLDHLAFVDTLQRMRHGQGFYAAFRDGLQSVGIVAGRADAFRFPLFFEIVRWIPPSMLHVAFYAFVVVGTSLVVLRLSSEPLAAVTVAGYLLLAGQQPIRGGSIADWMIVELWTVPLLAGALLAHRRRRWWLAAVLVGVAVLFRETNALLLLGGLLYAQRRDVPRKPWIVVASVCALAFAVHLHVATGYVRPHGTDAPLLGSGSFPSSVLHMLQYRDGLPALFALALWGVAWWRATRLGIVELVGPLLAIPLFGVVVERPYWGFLVMPFVIMWSTEVGVAALRRFAASRRRGDAGSSPPPRTPAPGPRTPVGVGAPPSAR